MCLPRRLITTPGRISILVLAAAAILTFNWSCKGSPPSSEEGGAAEKGTGSPGGADAVVSDRSGIERLPDGLLRAVPGEGTRRMAKILDDVIRGHDHIELHLNSAESAAYLREAIELARIPRQKIVLTTNLADVLMKIDRTQEAIDLAKPFLFPGAQAAVGAPPLSETQAFVGLGYLRIGGMKPCVTRHVTRACLLPFPSTATEEEKELSREAIRLFTAVLETDPHDLGARWLLNLGYMSIGEYPDGVPTRWLIPPRIFDFEYDVKRFEDVAPQVGIVVHGLAGGGVMEDFDGDDLLDIMVSSSGFRDQMHFFHNNGDGTFTRRTEEAGLMGLVGGINMSHADYDNDGDVDVLVARGGWGRRHGLFPNSLIRNNGDGTFVDVTEEAGLLSFHPTQSGMWGDYDNDGWLDLMVGNETMPDDPHPCELFHNNQDGTFTNKAVNLGDPAFGYVKAVAWGDYNNDNRLDLYLSMQDSENVLLRNDGPRPSVGPRGEDWLFTDVTRESGTGDPEDSFATWFWDYDNDGWLDLMVAGYKITDVGDEAASYMGMKNGTEVPRLYRNNGDGTFSDVTKKTRFDRAVLPMGANYGDIDNDGYLDAYFGTGDPSFRSMVPNQMYRNAEGKVFQDVTTSANVGHIEKGHGVAFGDIDNDGDQDLFEEMGGHYDGDVSQSVLYRNPGHGNRWITLRLEGRRSNRSAIGTRIRVRVNREGGERDIYVTVGTGGSFGSSSLQQEIGLGDATSIEVIEVSWPTTGEVQVFKGASLDSVYSIIEDDPELRPVQVKRFNI